MIAINRPLIVGGFLSSDNTMKVAIKEWNAIATWHWDIPEDEVCGICRVQFDGTCPTCKFPGDDCALGESTALSIAVLEC